MGTGLIQLAMEQTEEDDGVLQMPFSGRRLAHDRKLLWRSWVSQE